MKLNCIILLVILSGCQLEFPSAVIPVDYTGDPWALAGWIFDNIEYEEGGTDWKTPEETMRSMTGDCEDWTLLFLWNYYHYTGIKGEFVGGIKGGSKHAWARVPEGDFFYIPGYREFLVYSYDEAMTAAFWQ